MIQIVFQATGGILTSLFVLDAWHVAAFWWITLVFNLIPALMEIAVLVATFFLGIIVY